MATETTVRGSTRRQKNREIRLFLFLVIVLFPLVTVIAIGGYGMAVWLFQMVAGPPGPPGG